jgi:hypothetical protein
MYLPTHKFKFLPPVYYVVPKEITKHKKFVVRMPTLYRERETFTLGLPQSYYDNGKAKYNNKTQGDSES